LARILANNRLEGSSSYYLTPLGGDKPRQVEKGFNTKCHNSKPPAWLPERFTLCQMEFQSIIVNLTSAILGALSANDSDGWVSSSNVLFGSGPEEDRKEEDSDDHDSDRNEESSLDDNIKEEEEDRIVEMSMTPLPNMRYRAELD
jgi:hypothetical protein